MSDFCNFDDVIDVRDIIARVEELREERDAWVSGAPDGSETPNPNGWIAANADDANELETLESLLSDIAGYGGDEQWEGDWYPVALIRDSYFESYMDEMLEDIGDLPKDLPSYLSITVNYDALQQDYTSVEYEGVTYWYR